MWPNPQETEETFTEEILNGKLHFLCSVSYDVADLYPLVPIDRSIQVIIRFLQNDHAELKKRTKLNLTDIQQLLQLCLSECYFLYNNVIWALENSFYQLWLFYLNVTFKE